MVVICKLFFDDGSLLFYSFSEFEAEYIYCLSLETVFYFLKYVITDALIYGSAPDPLWGSRGDGHVASSLCTTLLPAQRARPGRWCTLLRLSHRCVQFPTFGFLTLTCHRDDTGASGRRVSFKLPWLSEQLWLSSSRSRARAGGSSVLTVEDSPTVVRGWRATIARKGSWCRRGIFKP